MPHQFMSIDYKKCKHHYCPVCERVCPECGEYDVVDDSTMVSISAMRLKVNKTKPPL